MEVIIIDNDNYTNEYNGVDSIFDTSDELQLTGKVCVDFNKDDIKTMLIIP